MGERTLADLKQKQALPLSVKVALTRERIRQWVHEFGEDGVYVSFSGGKDSTVLLDIVRNVCGYKDIPAVFVDVPTQHPELKEFVQTFERVIILKPKLSFAQVCEQYGFPLISKEVAQCVFEVSAKAKKDKCDKRDTTTWQRAFNPNSEHAKKFPNFSKAKWDFLNYAPFDCSHRCCTTMKKQPAKDYEKLTGRKPILGTMASESKLRETQWLKGGCNAFDVKRPTSSPMSFWMEQDVLQYIFDNKLKLCSVYGEVIEDFGDELEGQMSFEDLGLYDKPKKLKCSGCDRTGCVLCGFGAHLEKENESRFRKIKETHPKFYALLDVFKNNGVTYREAIEWTNNHMTGKGHIYL